MQLAWAGGDCEGLLRVLADYQMFAAFDANSRLIKVTTRGLPDLLMRADQTAVNFSVELAGDVNGDGLGDVWLRGGGYAQVLLDCPKSARGDGFL